MLKIMLYTIIFMSDYFVTVLQLYLVGLGINGVDVVYGYNITVLVYFLLVVIFQLHKMQQIPN